MKKLIRLCVILFAMFIGINYVEAFSIGASSTTIASGQTARLTINGSGFIGKYSISTSNAGVVAASEGSVWIEDGSYSITLSGLNVGSATITVTASDVSDTAGNPASGSQSVTINVVDRASSSNQKQQKDKKDMSKNNDLKNLSVEGFTLTPEFDKDKLEYDVTVPEDTKEINIIAQALDSNASIDGAGKKEVTEGTNTFDIIVRAENGDKKTYKINVLVKDENPINVTVDNKKYTVAKVLTDIDIPTGYKERTIKINDQDVPALYNKITKFTLVGLKDESGKITLFIYNKNKNTYTKYNELKANQLSILPLEFKGTLKGYEKTTITINGEKVEAYKYKKNSNYAIIYGLNLETGDKDYYLYNSEDGSLIIYDNQLINDLQNTIDLYTYIIIGLASAFILLLIILIVVAKKKKNNKKTMKGEKMANSIGEEITTHNRGVLGIISLILGIIGICISFIPIVNNASFFLGVIAIILGIISLIKKSSKAISIIAIMLGIASIAITLLLQSSWSKAIDDISKDLDTATGNNTEEVLKNVDITIGDFQVSTDEYGINNSKLIVKVTNKMKEKKSYDFTIEALDNEGNRLEQDFIYATDLGSGQSQEFEIFTFIESDKLDIMKEAEYKIIQASMY